MNILKRTHIYLTIFPWQQLILYFYSSLSKAGVLRYELTKPLSSDSNLATVTPCLPLCGEIDGGVG